MSDSEQSGLKKLRARFEALLRPATPLAPAPAAEPEVLRKTPKERFWPIIRDLIRPVLKAEGFVTKGNSFVKRVGEDIEIKVTAGGCLPIEDGAYHLALTVEVYSEEFARLGQGYEHREPWHPPAISMPVSCLRDRREWKQWNVHSEEEARSAGEEMRTLLVDYLIPHLPKWSSAELICQGYEKGEGIFHSARPEITDKWVRAYRAAKNSE